MLIWTSSSSVDRQLISVMASVMPGPPSWPQSVEHAKPGTHTMQQQSNMSVHHYSCVALCFVNIRQKGRFWDASLPSGSSMPNKDTSLQTLRIQVERGLPGGLLQLSGSCTNGIRLATANSFIQQCNNTWIHYSVSVLVWPTFLCEPFGIIRNGFYRPDALPLTLPTVSKH